MLEIFLLDQSPCKMVELVGWVAGVDDKESYMVITCESSLIRPHACILTMTVDDGDGSCVMPVKYYLPRIGGGSQASRVAPTPTPISVPPTQTPVTGSRKTFTTVAERRVKEEAAAQAVFEATQVKRAPVKVFQSKDIRVGDVVRVIGKIDEWARVKKTGREWIRGVTVEEGAGGRIGEFPSKKLGRAKF